LFHFLLKNVSLFDNELFICCCYCCFLKTRIIALRGQELLSALFWLYYVQQCLAQIRNLVTIVDWPTKGINLLLMKVDSLEVWMNHFVSKWCDVSWD
jgi:hypothetical protein